MDTYKPSPRATLTDGMRITWNTNRHQRQGSLRTDGGIVSRCLARHQPAARSGRSEQCARPVSGNAAVRLAAARFLRLPAVSGIPCVHGGFGVFNDIIPAQIADLAATNAPNASHLCRWHRRTGRRHWHRARCRRQRSRRRRQRQQFFPDQSSVPAAPPCAGIQPGAPTCPLAVSLNTFPSGTLKTPYYYQYNLGIEQQFGRTGQSARRLCRHPRTA